MTDEAAEMIATLAILKVLGHYGHLIDGQSWDRLHEVFTDDAVFYVEPSNATMIGWRGIAERFSKIKHPLGHHFTNPVIDVAPDGKTAKSIIKLLVVRENGLSQTGSYEDEFVLTDKGWRIAKRTARIRKMVAAEK
jgi:predicted transcriptional regulator